MCEQYMGWTNRETWAVNVWSDEAHEWKADAITEWMRRDLSGIALDEAVADWFDEFLGYLDDRETVLRDVGSFWRVNWHELASQWVSDWWQNERDRQFAKDHYDESNISGIVGGDEYEVTAIHVEEI